MHQSSLALNIVVQGHGRVVSVYPFFRELVIVVHTLVNTLRRGVSVLDDAVDEGWRNREGDGREVATDDNNC